MSEITQSNIQRQVTSAPHNTSIKLPLTERAILTQVELHLAEVNKMVFECVGENWYFTLRERRKSTGFRF